METKKIIKKKFLSRILLISTIPKEAWTMTLNYRKIGRIVFIYKQKKESFAYSAKQKTKKICGWADLNT